MLYKNKIEELEYSFLGNLIDDMDMYENIMKSKELTDVEYEEYQNILYELARRNYFRNECSALDTETQEENELHAKRMNTILDAVFIDSLFELDKKYTYIIEWKSEQEKTGVIVGTNIFKFIQSLSIKEGIDVSIKGNDVIIYTYLYKEIRTITIQNCI